MLISPDEVKAKTKSKENENYAFRTYLKMHADPLKCPVRRLMQMPPTAAQPLLCRRYLTEEMSHIRRVRPKKIHGAAIRGRRIHILLVIMFIEIFVRGMSHGTWQD